MELIGVLGDTLYPAGYTLTEYDMLRECPFPNQASLISITGSDLKYALEQALRKLPARAGNFPQVSGLRIKVDLSRNTMNRITEILVEEKKKGEEGKEGEETIEWKPLEDSRVYICAVTEFIRNGGDGLDGFTKGTCLQSKAKLLSKVVREYIISHKEIAPVKEGRVVVL